MVLILTISIIAQSISVEGEFGRFERELIGEGLKKDLKTTITLN